MSDDDSDSPWEEQDSSEQLESNDDDDDDWEMGSAKKKPAAKKAAVRKAAAKSKPVATKKPTAKAKPVAKTTSAAHSKRKSTPKSTSAAVKRGDESIKAEPDGSISHEPGKSPSEPRKRPRRVLITEDEIEAESQIPSFERLTAKGGYAATAAQRKKIALANRGKQPWNKGKNRSAQDIEKIKAAVRARNQRQLEANLRSVGMSQDEYEKCKQKIKLLRENVRKAIVVNTKKQENDKAQAEKAKLLAEMEANNDDEEEEGDEDDNVKLKPREEHQTVEREEQESHSQSGAPALTSNEGAADAAADTTQLAAESHTTDSEAATGDDSPNQTNKDLVTEEKQEEHDEPYNIEMVPEIFRRDFEWSPHPVYGFGDEPVEGKCPDGGPGGLICCQHCTKVYSDYLNSTFDELESQKIAKVAAELETIDTFIQVNHDRLTNSVRVAQRQPPPAKLGET